MDSCYQFSLSFLFSIRFHLFILFVSGTFSFSKITLSHWRLGFCYCGWLEKDTYTSCILVLVSYLHFYSDSLFLYLSSDCLSSDRVHPCSCVLPPRSAILLSLSRPIPTIALSRIFCSRNHRDYYYRTVYHALFCSTSFLSNTS